MNNYCVTCETTCKDGSITKVYTNVSAVDAVEAERKAASVFCIDDGYENVKLTVSKMVSKMKWCPRCRVNMLRDVELSNSLSRRDNETFICSRCGDEEALIDAKIMEVTEVEKRFLKFIARKGGKK